MAGVKGLEPSTFCVTGRRSNQLSYTPVNGQTPVGLFYFFNNFGKHFWLRAG